LHATKNKFNIKDHGAPKSARPVAIATFATIVLILIFFSEE